MIKAQQTHCFLDCLAYVIQLEQQFDERPLYCGIWNAPFSVTEQGISYFSDSIGMEGILSHFELLYGESITLIHDYTQPKPENYAAFKSLMAARTSHQFLIILVDLYYLPYPNNCYQSRHRPHIVICHSFSTQGCLLIDPYFSWEGNVTFEVLEQAFAYEDLMSVILLDTKRMQQPEMTVIATSMKQQLELSPSLLYTEVIALIDRVIIIGIEFSLSLLYPWVEQVAVLAKRMNGYERIYSFFNQALNIAGSEASSKVAKLVQKWDSFILAIVRIGITENHSGLVILRDKLIVIGQLELDIKADLIQLQHQWGGIQHRIQA